MASSPWRFALAKNNITTAKAVTKNIGNSNVVAYRRSLQ